MYVYCFLMIKSVFVFKFIYLFFEGDKDSTSGGWDREKGRERIRSRICTVTPEPDVGLELTNCEIMTWAEIQSRMLIQLSHPGASRRDIKMRQKKVMVRKIVSTSQSVELSLTAIY